MPVPGRPWAKKGTPNTHPIRDELRVLCCMALAQDPESWAPFPTAGFARLVERAGAAAEFGFGMLRHACGFALANKPAYCLLYQRSPSELHPPRTPSTGLIRPECGMPPENPWHSKATPRTLGWLLSLNVDVPICP
jgi:hypothetical protein